jgi:hypothetical protein
MDFRKISSDTQVNQFLIYKKSEFPLDSKESCTSRELDIEFDGNGFSEK